MYGGLEADIFDKDWLIGCGVLFFSSKSRLQHSLIISFYTSLWVDVATFWFGSIWVFEKKGDKLGWAEPHSKFPLGFPINFPCESHSLNKIQLDQWLLRYSTFNILKSSSIGGRLHCKPFSILVWSPYLKFQIWLQSNQ